MGAGVSTISRCAGISFLIFIVLMYFSIPCCGSKKGPAKDDLNSRVAIVGFIADDSELFALRRDGSITTWDLSTQKTAATSHLKALGVLRSACRHNLLYLGDYKSIKVVSLKPLTSPRVLPGSTRGLLNALAVSPDGKWLAVAEYFPRADMYSEVRIRDAKTGEARVVMAMGGEEECLLGTTDSVAFSPDGRLLAWGGPHAGLHLWEAATGKFIRIVTMPGGGEDIGENRLLQFSPDGRWLAAARNGMHREGNDAYDDGAEIMLWKVADGSPQWKIPALKKDRDIGAIAFSPRGDMLAVSEFDGSIRLLDIEKGTVWKSLKCYGSKVTALAWSAGGTYLAAGDDQGEVILWDISRREGHQLAPGGR
jgi:WD40 repeat protein